MRITSTPLFLALISLAGVLPASLCGADSPADEVRALREQLARQQSQIEQLRQHIDEQAKTLDRLVQRATTPQATAAEAAQPVVPATTTAEVDAASVGGFKFGGDFRLRFDSITRSGNDYATPVQNVRERYRLRLNVDKELDHRFRFHVQLSTGPMNNPITQDQDMAGIDTRAPISISEAYVDFRPHPKVTLRSGRAAEVFADNMRFLWDDDLRLNGFSQTVALPLAKNPLGITSVELRSGEYLLSNPAVYVLSASSPYVSAGYEVGGKVRSSNLFHPGVVVKGGLGKNWSQQILGAVEIYRNPNQIQLASTSAGYAVLVNGALGLALSGPLSGSGNATTTSGGSIYTAPDFHVSHVGYRLERKGINIGGRQMPFWLDLQASRNHGASFLQDAFMASVNLGSIKQRGDVRALYQFSIKDANSMISQFTDDDLGTGSGVNLATHAMRLDVGLTKFLQFQNLVFIQNQRRDSNPSQQLFVPLGRSANTTVRWQSQFAFTF
jgi:hypothetical protein